MTKKIIDYETASKTMQGIIEKLNRTNPELFYVKGVPPIGALVEIKSSDRLKSIVRRTGRSKCGTYDFYDCYRNVESGECYSPNSVMNLKVDGNEQRFYRILDKEQPTDDKPN